MVVAQQRGHGTPGRLRGSPVQKVPTGEWVGSRTCLGWFWLRDAPGRGLRLLQGRAGGKVGECRRRNVERCGGILGPRRGAQVPQDLAEPVLARPLAPDVLQIENPLYDTRDRGSHGNGGGGATSPTVQFYAT